MGCGWEEKGFCGALQRDWARMFRWQCVHGKWRLQETQAGVEETGRNTSDDCIVTRQVAWLLSKRSVISEIDKLMTLPTRPEKGDVKSRLSLFIGESSSERLQKEIIYRLGAANMMAARDRSLFRNAWFTSRARYRLMFPLPTRRLIVMRIDQFQYPMLTKQMNSAAGSRYGTLCTRYAASDHRYMCRRFGDFPNSDHIPAHVSSSEQWEL